MLEIIKTSKTSILIDNIEHNLIDIKNNIDKITKNRQQNMSEIRQQRRLFQDKIKEMRVKINSHLDTLEQNILQELDDTAYKNMSKIDELLKQLSQISKSVERLQRDIRAVKEYGSDLQTFVGSKAIEEEVNKEEENLMALSEDRYLQQTTLRYHMNTKIKDVLSTITTFGTVSIEASPPSVVVKTMKAAQAHIMSVIQHPSVKSINDVKLTLHTTFNIPKGQDIIGITECIVSPNGKMIFVDCYNNGLIILNEDGTLDKKIHCSLGNPFDVTCLDDTTVAVSTLHGIEIININSTKTERRIQTSKPCCGITHHKGVVLWCEPERGIQMMKLSDGRVNTLVKQRNMPYHSFITTCGYTIYQANRDTSTVICYTTKGKKLWEYKDTSVLNGPHAITMDNKYNVYVTSFTSNNIVVLEPNGRQGRQLISSDGGLTNPTGIYVNKSKNSLLVTSYRGPAFLYHMF